MKMLVAYTIHTDQFPRLFMVKSKVSIKWKFEQLVILIFW